MFRHAVLGLLLLPGLAQAIVPGVTADPANPSPLTDGTLYLQLGSLASLGGEDWNGQPDVKPYHNARKYGLNRSSLDRHPALSVALGYESVRSPFFVELGFDGGYLTYENAVLAGPLLVNNTVSSQIFSVTLAPGWRFPSRYGSVALGCRLGWSELAAKLESATPTALLGKLEQRSDIFTYEPFVRLDFYLLEWLRFGLDFGYAARNFWQISNSNGSGVYAGAPAVEKNPDGTDTSVDLSGMTSKIFVTALMF